MRRRFMGSKSPELFTFTVQYSNDIEFNSEKDMTWNDWLQSKYNVYYTTNSMYYGEMVGTGNSVGQTNGYAIIFRTGERSEVASSTASQTITNYYTYYEYLDGVSLTDTIIPNNVYVLSTCEFLNRTETKASDCLVRGSKILLADGTYKKVEDIGYNDLLTTYDFTTGKITYNYPGLILYHQNRHRRCMRLCFENNVEISITSRHHLYDYVKNEFSTIDLDRDEFDRPPEGFVGTYYSVEQKQFIPLRLLSFEEFYIDDIAYDIQVSGQEVIMAEGLLSGNDTMNLFPKEGFMLYNKDLCDAFKAAIANKDFETNEYIWFKDNISSEYPFWAWRCDYMWAFHMATENSGVSDEIKENIYQAMRNYLVNAIPYIQPKDDTYVVLNINNEQIIYAKYGDKITLPNTHSKYYDNSKFLTYDAGDEVEVITSTYIEALW